MTPEQDFERRLADWLSDGPSMAPAEVVDRALEQTSGRRQRRGVQRWFSIPSQLKAQWRSTGGLARVVPVAAVAAGLLLVGLILSLPSMHQAGPAPGMTPSEIRTIAGVASTNVESTTPGRLTRTLEFAVEDPRIDGVARQEFEILLDTESGMSIARGVMHLQNAWGTWDGPVDLVGYPGGGLVETAALAGSGAYAGFTYHYAIYDQPAGTERTLRGAIWPDEPPAMPDPSLLP